MNGSVTGIPALALGALLAVQGCSNPAGPGSRRVFFCNETYVPYRIRTQMDRLQMPVESTVLPGDTLDITLMSLETGRLFVALEPVYRQQPGPTFLKVELEIELGTGGRVDTTSFMALTKSGAVDNQVTQTLRDSLKLETVYSSNIVIEAHEFQDSLRIYMDNQTDSSYFVTINYPAHVEIPSHVDTVEVETGLFPITEKVARDSLSITVQVEDKSLLLPQEKDVLLQIYRVSEGSLQVDQRWDLPPDMRTSVPQVYYRLLRE